MVDDANLLPVVHGHRHDAVVSCFTEASTPTQTGRHLVGTTGRARSPAVDTIPCDEGRLGRYPTVFDHAEKGVGPELSPHLLDPHRRLPRRDRFVMPGHQQARLRV